MVCYSFEGEAKFITSIPISPESVVRVSQDLSVPLFFIGDGKNIVAYSLMHDDLRQIFSITTPEFEDFIITEKFLVLSTFERTIVIGINFTERGRPIFGEANIFEFGGYLKMINKDFAIVDEKKTKIFRGSEIEEFDGELICLAPGISETVKIGRKIYIGEKEFVELLPGDRVECYYQILVAIGKNHLTIIDTEKKKVLVSYNIPISSFYHYQGIVLTQGEEVLNMLSLQTIDSFIIASNLGDPEITFRRNSHPPYDFTEDIWDDSFDQSMKIIEEDGGQFPAFEMGKDIEIY